MGGSKSKRRVLVARLIAIGLALGVLPSFIGISRLIEGSIISPLNLGGPLNPLKFLAPVLFYYVFTERKRVPVLLRKWLPVIWVLGTIATVISASLCGFPANILREWAVLTVGGLAGLSWILLPSRLGYSVAVAWLVQVASFAAVDLVFPEAIDWLHNHVFDSHTRDSDHEIGNLRALGGVWGRQSLAKLLVWIPWIWILFKDRAGGLERWDWIEAALIFSVSTALILFTSQRGPFIAAGIGCAAFVFHRAIWLGNWRILFKGFAASLVLIGISIMVMPKAMYDVRIAPLLGKKPQSIHDQYSLDTISWRVRTNQLTFEVIANSPLGDACIPKAMFSKYRVTPAHSHNIFLEQFRIRGWVWGLLHLAIWVLCVFGAWRGSSINHGILFGGISANLAIGLFDHPWSVLNHSTVIVVLLMLGLWNLEIKALRFGRH